MIDIRESWLDDVDELETGNVMYIGQAFYGKNFTGLASSEDFTNESDAMDWVWDMCQKGYSVTLDDLDEYGGYLYFKWPENAAYLDLYNVDDLETDEQGNFLNIDDIGPK